MAIKTEIMEHLTMQELEDLGFEIVRSRSDGKKIIQQRQKGKVTIETTWLISGGFVSQRKIINKK